MCFFVCLFFGGGVFQIVGIRALEMKEDKAVIDIDLRWAGNAEFMLEAGVKPVPLLITLNKICFSGRMRVELAPLVPMFPCFGAGVCVVWLLGYFVGIGRADRLTNDRTSVVYRDERRQHAL